MTPAEKIEMQWAYLCHVNAYYVQAVTFVMTPPAANDADVPESAA